MGDLVRRAGHDHRVGSLVAGHIMVARAGGHRGHGHRSAPGIKRLLGLGRCGTGIGTQKAGQNAFGLAGLDELALVREAVLPLVRVLHLLHDPQQPFQVARRVLKNKLVGAAQGHHIAVFPHQLLQLGSNVLRDRRVERDHQGNHLGAAPAFKVFDSHPGNQGGVDLLVGGNQNEAGLPADQDVALLVGIGVQGLVDDVDDLGNGVFPVIGALEGKRSLRQVA